MAQTQELSILKEAEAQLRAAGFDARFTVRSATGMWPDPLLVVNLEVRVPLGDSRFQWDEARPGSGRRATLQDLKPVGFSHSSVELGFVTLSISDAAGRRDIGDQALQGYLRCFLEPHPGGIVGPMAAPEAEVARERFSG